MIPEYYSVREYIQIKCSSEAKRSNAREIGIGKFCLSLRDHLKAILI